MNEIVLQEFLDFLDKNNLDNESILKIQSILSKNEIDKKDYRNIIKLLFKELNINSENANKLFLNSPKVFIVFLKKVLNLYAERNWDVYKEKNSSIFINFSKNICNYLDDHSFEETILSFDEQLTVIKNIDLELYKNLMIFLKEYRLSSNKYLARGFIRDFTRKFNAKCKKLKIEEYIGTELHKLEDNFIQKEKLNKVSKLISKEHFLTIVFSSSLCTNYLKNSINDIFDKEILNKELDFILKNMLSNEDEKNYSLLGIPLVSSFELDLLKENKACNRFELNYLKKINENFSLEEKRLLVELINEGKNYKSYSHLFSNFSLSRYTEFKLLFLETNSKLVINNDNIEIVRSRSIDDLTLLNIKEKLNEIFKYNSVKRKVYKLYSGFSKDNMQDIESLPFIKDIFDDDNYIFNNISKIINLKLLIDIIKKIDVGVVNSYDEETIKEIKKVVFDSGLFGAVLILDDSNIDIASIINNFNTIKNYLYDKNKKINFDFLIKRANLFNIVDDFSLSLLGQKVAEKLVNNRQFLQSYNPNIVSERLEKADYIMLKSDYTTLSSVPYIEEKSKDIKITRYFNNDTELLTSGIDTNTCFSLCANDNDYVLYTFLNPNGVAFKITDNFDNYIGRATAHLFGNTLFINGIRTYDEKDTCLTKEKLIRNRNIMEALINLANKFIEVTKDNEVPIDFVVCNKAGILESSEFDYSANIISPNVYKTTSIDIYNDDWIEFLRQGGKYLNQASENIPFSTDYGSFPAILIASRDNKFLDSIRNIALHPEKPIYERPRKTVRCISEPLSEEDLDEINSINARKYYYENGCTIKEARNNYRMKHINSFYKIYLGEDWYCIYYDELNYEIVSVRNSEIANKEIEYVKNQIIKKPFALEYKIYKNE